MLEERHAVTVFLESEQEILILLRSQKVSTYRGKWGGVSGVIDSHRTPDEQALAEIEEETGLPADIIELRKKGDPLVFDDEKLKVKKVIYPYLFHVKDRDRIRIDWEHTQMKWIQPGEMDNYDTMPRLKETLDRVLFSPET